MKKVGVFVSALFLSVSLFSCANLTPNGGGADNSVEINFSDLPEISIPLSPTEAEAAYADAQTFMDQKVMVPHDDAHPDLYYVMIFVTNHIQMNSFLTCYVPYSTFPIQAFETNEAAPEYEGIFYGTGYSNVMPYYALITSKHYNEFLNSKILIFKPIRNITYTELSNLGGLNISFIEGYDQEIMESGFTNTIKSKSTIWDIFRDIWFGIASIFAATNKDFNIYLKYKAIDPITETMINKGVPKLRIQFWEAGVVDTRVDENGYVKVRLWDGATYDIDIIINAHYAWYSEEGNNSAVIKLGKKQMVNSRYDLLLSDEKSVKNIGFFMDTFYQLNKFAKNEGLIPGSPRVWIGATGDPNVAGEGNIDHIVLQTYAQYWISFIAHEYGHYLLDLYKENLTWQFGDKIIYPDGTPDPTYYNNSVCLNNEGWAEFFRCAFMRYKYNDFKKDSFSGSLEANYGSKEVVFGAIIDPYKKSIGAKDGLFLFQFDFPRYYKEASILYDLWDKNENQVYIIDGKINGAVMNYSCVELNSSCFKANTEFSDAFYYSLTYDKQAVSNREMEMDQISLPINAVFSIVVWSQHYNLKLEDYMRIYAQNHGLVEEMSKLLDLHSIYYPVYTPGLTPDDMKLKSVVNSNGSITLSWNPISSLVEYKVYKDTGSGFFYDFTIQQWNSLLSSYLITSELQPNVQYIYKISVKSGTNESALSNPVTNIIPIPLAPSGFQTKELNSVRVSMKWNAVPGALKYVIQKISSNITSGTKTTININVTGTEYTDNSIVVGTRYIYKICSQNYAGKGTNSATVIDISLSGPQIELFTPTNNSTNGYNNVYFSGSALSDGDHPATNVYIRFDGGAYTSVSVGTNGEWSKLVSFSSKGDHKVYYCCVDENGISNAAYQMEFYVNKMYVINVSSTVGSKGIGDGQFSNTIFSMALDSSGYSYVVDHDNFRVEKFLLTDPAGTYITKWGSKGTADTQFGEYQGHGPKGIVYSSLSNRVIVADVVNCYMKFFDTAGVYKGKWYWPYASGYLGKMAVSGNYLYVTDFFSGGKVTIFTMKGSKVGSLGVGKLSSSEQGIAVYGDRVYIADSGYSKIMVFSTNGTFISEFGSYGTGTGQFMNPQGIDADDKYIYVADTGNNRIQIFDHFFNNVGSFNFANSFASPTDVKVKYLSGSTGYLFVLEQGNYRIQKLLLSY